MSARFQDCGDARRDRGPGRHRVVRGLMPELRRDHLRLRRRAARKRVRGQPAARRAADRPRPSDQRRGGDQHITSGSSGRDFIAAIEARIGGRASRRIPRAHARSRASRASRGLRRGRRRGRFRPRRCRPTCPRRSLRRARRAGSRTISPISASPTRSATTCLQRPRACRARQAGARPLSPRRASARRRRSTHCAIIEDSPVGATGALASGARVIGLVAGAHCLDGHADDAARRSASSDIAHSFDEVARLLGSRARCPLFLRLVAR